MNDIEKLSLLLEPHNPREFHCVFRTDKSGKELLKTDGSKTWFASVKHLNWEGVIVSQTDGSLMASRKNKKDHIFHGLWNDLRCTNLEDAVAHITKEC